MTPSTHVGPIPIGSNHPLVLIAGPCVIENAEITLRTAERLKAMTNRLGIPWIFKSSFDKANRSSVASFRGPGLEEGLAILERVRKTFDVPVLSDIHSPEQAKAAAGVLDVIQIPAFLCRQTDMLIAAGETGCPVNIKKGQFMAPEDMVQAARKVGPESEKKVMITERGVTFGYHNLVVDMRSLAVIRETGYPVIFDATHSVQRPAALGTASDGDRQFVPVLARAAVAAGVDGVFMEVHPDPDSALCDGPNMWPLDRLEFLLRQLMALDAVIRNQSEDLS